MYLISIRLTGDTMLRLRLGIFIILRQWMKIRSPSVTWPKRRDGRQVETFIHT